MSLGSRNIFSFFFLCAVLFLVVLCSAGLFAEVSTFDGSSTLEVKRSEPKEDAPLVGVVATEKAAKTTPAGTSVESRITEVAIPPSKPSSKVKNTVTPPEKTVIETDIDASAAKKNTEPLSSVDVLRPEVPLKIKSSVFKKTEHTPYVKNTVNKTVRVKKPKKQIKAVAPTIHRFEQAVFSNWDKYKRYRGKKDWIGVEQTLENIFVKQMQVGMISQRILSAVLVLDAENETEQGNYAGSVLLLKYAKKISDGYYLPYFASAKTVFLNNPLHVSVWGQDLSIGVLNKVKSFQGMMLFARFFILVFSLALLITFFVFSILQAVKKYPLVLHDISEYFPSLLPSVKKLLAGVFIFLPIFTLSVFWIVSYELVLFFRYMSRRERAVSIVFFMFIASFPYILNFLASSIILEGKTEFWAVSKSIEKSWYPGITNDMKRVVSTLNKNSTGALSSRFLLALATKKEGNFNNANAMWAKLASEKFEPYRVFVNYGNTYFAQKNFSKAADFYNRSLEYSKKPLLSVYNLSQTYSSSFLGDEASKLYTDAMSISVKKVENFDVIGKIPGFNTAVVDAYLPVKYFFNIARELAGDFHNTSEFFSESLFRRVGLSNYKFAALIFIIISVIWGSVARERLPLWCGKCGKVFCKAHSGALSEGVCDECFAVFYKKSKAHSRVKRILMMKIHNEKRSYISYAISVFLPGGGHLYEGELLLGLLVLFFSAFFVSGWVFHGFILGTQAISLHISSVIFFLLLVPFFVMYMLVLWDIRLKTKI